MISKKLKKQIEFINEVEKLKAVKRANKTLDDGRFENSAEHSWHVALIAVLLEEYAESELDLLKVVKMLLIHDLVEIDAGDTWIFSNDQDLKQSEEIKGANRLFSILPAEQGNEYLELWYEFENRGSEEAEFAAAIDSIQPLINHILTGDPADGTISAKKVYSKKEHIALHAPKLWGLVEESIANSIELGLYEN